MWYSEKPFYQIYPLGFCGAPARNDGVLARRIGKVAEWIPHMQKLGVGTVLLNPIFDSDAHGYDSRDLNRIDPRLGDKEDFARLCDALHAAGLRVVLDGVFNHVGRGFWAFADLLEKREASAYRDWFFVDFSRDSAYGDGLWYDGWEGHYDLVKLNLQNEQVVKYLLDAVGGWIDAYGIDGIRLDVAYCLPPDFMRLLRSFTNGKKPDFFLVGEMLHGDYKAIAAPGMLNSATNYECYKGLYSSLNAHNLFEIAYSLNRQFGPEDWTLYKGLPLLNFVDNHDVTRAASILENPAHLPLLYGLLLGMPGLPCIYYGSEWGAEGRKGQGPGGDDALRPAFGAPVENELFATVAAMCAARAQSAALREGDYTQAYLTNRQFIFRRAAGGQRVLVAVNADAEAHVAHFDAQSGTGRDLIGGGMVDFGGGYEMPPYSVCFLQLE